MKLLRRVGPSICFQNMWFLISQTRGKSCGFLSLFLWIWCCIWSRIFKFVELFSTVQSLYLSAWPWTWRKLMQKSRLLLESSSTIESSLPVQMGELLLLSTLTTSRWTEKSWEKRNSKYLQRAGGRKNVVQIRRSCIRCCVRWPCRVSWRWILQSRKRKGLSLEIILKCGSLAIFLLTGRNCQGPSKTSWDRPKDQT